MADFNLKTENDFGDLDQGEKNYLGEEKHNILLNRCAFVELLIGYILSIWSGSGNKSIIILGVASLTIFICLVTWGVTKKYAYRL